jgi:hypothetical protein
VADYGVSVLGDYTLAGAFTIGAGVFFSHLLSVNKDYTTPRNPLSLVPLDSTGGDTLYYTFRGTKLMARLAFDPKVFFASEFFGKSDLRLYSEATLIGVKNYPGWYNERWRRIPVMVGFNVPAFRFLDVLAVELEWYKSKLPNGYNNVYTGLNLPVPDDTSGYDYKQDQLKWSIHAENNWGDYLPLPDNWRKIICVSNGTRTIKNRTFRTPCINEGIGRGFLSVPSLFNRRVRTASSEYEKDFVRE